ncbi:MAG TPA: 2-dehydropantoate 2-reductase [Bacteroidota bacterium]|nr:2-dehydropantoate 2-reductase [Bacteroidota bacterium]
MKFAVVGAGGVGGYFGGKLAAHGENVWFVARGSHLEAMKAHGLQVKSFEGDFRVPPGRMSDSPAEVGQVDVVLFCVKSYDTETAARSLDPLLSPDTIIISLQNGVDNVEKIRRLIPRGIVFGGVAYIYATIASPGIVSHTVGPTKIVFGPWDESDAGVLERASEIRRLMQEAGINAELADDIRVEMWKKFVFISAVGGMTALTRLTLGEILAVPATRDMLADAMRETLAVARARGVNLPADLTEQILEILKRYDNNSRSSMYHDLVHGRRMEVEAFSGVVVREGERLGIPTPVHRALYAALLPHHLKHAAA